MLTDDIKRFLQISEESIQDICGTNGIGHGFGYGHGIADGIGNLNSTCLCNSGKDSSSIRSIKEIYGYDVHIIDEIPTIIVKVRNNIAAGYILRDDLSLKNCYIAKVGNVFAHGESVKQAYNDAIDKAIISECVGCVPNYVNYVISKYPNIDEEISNAELYELHNIITGSCTFGRDEFINAHNIDLNGRTTMREFLNLVKYSYGSDKIQELLDAYNTK